MSATQIGEGHGGRSPSCSVGNTCPTLVCATLHVRQSCACFAIWPCLHRHHRPTSISTCCAAIAALAYVCRRALLRLRHWSCGVPLIRSPLSKKEVLTTGRRPGAVGGDTDNHHGSRCGRGRVQLREEEEGQTGSERTIVHTLHARWVGPTIFLDRVGLFLENILVKCCTIAMVPTKHGTGPSHPVPTIQTKQTQLE
jgi:hypothetical protein